MENVLNVAQNSELTLDDILPTAINLKLKTTVAQNIFICYSSVDQAQHMRSLKQALNKDLSSINLVRYFTGVRRIDSKVTIGSHEWKFSLYEHLKGAPIVDDSCAVCLQPYS